MGAHYKAQKCIVLYHFVIHTLYSEDAEQSNLAHKQILSFLESLLGCAVLLLNGQRVVSEADLVVALPLWKRLG
jgi:hypothetical protein